MRSSKFIPTSDSDKVDWLNNFANKMGLYSTSLGLTATELTALQKDTAHFSYLITDVQIRLYSRVTSVLVKKLQIAFSFFYKTFPGRWKVF